MLSSQSSLVVIACPHCGTRYQVPPETLGQRGRRVSCAHCGKAWLAETPVPRSEDRLFTPREEEELDREFDALEAIAPSVPESIRKMLPAGDPPPPEVVKSIAEIKAAIAPKVPEPPNSPPPEHKPTKAEKAAKGRLEKRQRQFGEALPAARLLRAIRLAAVLLLIAVAGGLYWFRTEIVRLVPDMAGVYAALGMGVNVVGLEFSDVSTVMTRHGDDSVLSVIAKIRAVEPRRVSVPPVVVTLLDEHGASVYQWSVVPAAGDIAPGEALDFSAELASPPQAAAELRLSFAEGRPRSEAVSLPHAAATETAVPAPDAPEHDAPTHDTTTNETH